MNPKTPKSATANNASPQWAGPAFAQSSCASLAESCEAFVSNSPQAFTDAYWAINTLQVFQDDGTGNSPFSSPNAGTGDNDTSTAPAFASAPSEGFQPSTTSTPTYSDAPEAPVASGDTSVENAPPSSSSYVGPAILRRRGGAVLPIPV
jgi:hypothetical protein